MIEKYLALCKKHEKLKKQTSVNNLHSYVVNTWSLSLFLFIVTLAVTLANYYAYYHAEKFIQLMQEQGHDDIIIFLKNIAYTKANIQILEDSYFKEVIARLSFVSILNIFYLMTFSITSLVIFKSTNKEQRKNCFGAEIITSVATFILTPIFLFILAFIAFIPKAVYLNKSVTVVSVEHFDFIHAAISLFEMLEGYNYFVNFALPLIMGILFAYLLLDLNKLKDAMKKNELKYTIEEREKSIENMKNTILNDQDLLINVIEMTEKKQSKENMLILKDLINEKTSHLTEAQKTRIILQHEMNQNTIENV